MVRKESLLVGNSWLRMKTVGFAGSKGGEMDEEKFRSLRLARGVYGQRQPGVQMVRIKLPCSAIGHGSPLEFLNFDMINTPPMLNVQRWAPSMWRQLV